MVFRLLFRYLSNNEQLVQKLSESLPVRRAAQLFVSFYYKGQSAIQKSGVQDTLTPDKFRSFIQSFSRNLKNEVENAKRNLKKK